MLAQTSAETVDGVEKLDILRMPKNTSREIALHATFGTSVKLRHPYETLSRRHLEFFNTIGHFWRGAVKPDYSANATYRYESDSVSALAISHLLKRRQASHRYRAPAWPIDFGASCSRAYATLSGFTENVHAFPVGGEYVSAAISESRGREGSLVFDPLFNLNNVGFLKTSKLHRKIASRELCGTLQEKEVGLFARRENGEDCKPCRFVDNAINLRHLEVVFVTLHGFDL